MAETTERGPRVDAVEKAMIRRNRERIAGGPIRALTINITELVHAARDVVTIKNQRATGLAPAIAELAEKVERFKHLD